MMQTSLTPQARSQFKHASQSRTHHAAALSASRPQHHPCVSTVDWTARPSTTTSTLPPSKTSLHLQQQQQQQEEQQQKQQQFEKLNVSKRQLLAFGCACCFSLQAQQQLPAAADSGPYSYEGSEGPTHWPGACSSGTQQSPINLTLNQVKCDGRGAPDIRYQTDRSAAVLNTGHTLQVNLQPGSNSIAWAGQELELLQYHFHTPSEHTVEGVPSSMEAHLVHRNKETGAFTVLAVLMEAPSAAQQQPSPNPCLAAALQNVPSTAGTTAPCSSPVNPADLLPTGSSREQYVAYRGSLTTPPCSEGVDWLVWTQPVAVPQQQVQQFAAFAKMNARPVQPLNGRSVAFNCITSV